MLKNVISNMNPEDAEYHFKRCIDSGLWVPNPEDKNQDEAAEQYEKVDDSKPQEE